MTLCFFSTFFSISYQKFFWSTKKKRKNICARIRNFTNKKNIWILVKTRPFPTYNLTFLIRKNRLLGYPPAIYTISWNIDFKLVKDVLKNPRLGTKRWKNGSSNCRGTRKKKSMRFELIISNETKFTISRYNQINRTFLYMKFCFMVFLFWKFSEYII